MRRTRALSDRLGLWIAVGLLLVACGEDAPAADPTSASSGAGTTGTGGDGGAGGGGPTCPPGSHAAPDGGCEATLAEWSTGPSLAQRRDHHLTFVASSEAGPFIYAAGGVVDNGELLDSIELAPIQPDGTLGPWSSASTLPEVIAGAAVAVVGTTVVMTGGYRMAAVSATLSKKTDVAVLGADGTLQTWAAGPEMSLSRFHHAMVAHGDSLYVIGGLTGNNTDNTPKVERAMITGSDVAAWTEVTPLPGRRSHHSAATDETAIFVTGGLEGNPAGEYTSFGDVLRAQFLEEGGLGDWVKVGDLPTTLGTHSSFVHAGMLYVVGGIEGDSHNTAAVRRSPIGEDGTLGAWEELPALPTARAHAHQSPLYQGFVYAVAGAYNHDSMADVFIGRFE